MFLNSLKQNRLFVFIMMFPFEVPNKVIFIAY